MTPIFNNNILTLPNGARKIYPFPISKIIFKEGFVVSLLDVPIGKSMTENVFGIFQDGTREWQIEQTESTCRAPENCYLDIGFLETGELFASNWNSTVVTLDIETGKVKTSKFVK